MRWYTVDGLKLLGRYLPKELFKKRGSPSMVKFPVLRRMTDVGTMDDQR